MAPPPAEAHAKKCQNAILEAVPAAYHASCRVKITIPTYELTPRALMMVHCIYPISKDITSPADLKEHLSSFLCH